MANFIPLTKSGLSSTGTPIDPPVESDASLWQSLHRAAVQPPVAGAIERLYQQIDQAVAQHNPTCWTSGRCCQFDAFGHRLFVTGLEIAWVLSQHRALPASAGIQDRTVQTPLDPTGPCRFQTQGLCGVHRIRPLGCRIFFCQAGTGSWQNRLYEQFLARLRSLHDRHGLPYRYLEWRHGLAEAQRHTPPQPPAPTHRQQAAER